MVEVGKLVWFNEVRIFFDNVGSVFIIKEL